METATKPVVKHLTIKKQIGGGMKTKGGKKVYEMLVTPEIAQDWLDNHNEKNRRISNRTVMYYAAQMKEGKWEETVDPIQFSEKGRLLNGQHRLSAIVMSSIPQMMLIVENLSEKSFSVMDTGKSRTAADVVSTLNMRYTTALTGAAKGIMLYEKGFMQEPSKASKIAAVTHDKIYKFIKAHQEELEEIARETFNVYNNCSYIGHTILVTMYYLFSKVNISKTEKFFEQYGTGIGLAKTSPILILRQKLMHNTLNKTKYTPKDKAALLIMTWNAYIKNKETSLILKAGYEFPKIVGYNA